MDDEISVGLVEHEMAHLLGGLFSGATKGTISHDGHSWRCDLEWPVEQPTAEQVTAPHIIGTMIRPEYSSPEDRILASVVPSHLMETAKTLAIVVQAELDRLGPDYIGYARNKLIDNGVFALRKYRGMN
jgi:hypothetical protein